MGDCCRISLPRWVLEAGEADPDIFFTDSSGYRNRECLSVGADEQPVLAGRTPIQAQVRVVAALQQCCGAGMQLCRWRAKAGVSASGAAVAAACLPAMAGRCCSIASAAYLRCLTFSRPFWAHRLAQADFIAAFADEFGDLLGGVITEVTIGMGPAGELRYPSYPEGDGRWRFPGIGQFQCYDK